MAGILAIPTNSVISTNPPQGDALVGWEIITSKHKYLTALASRAPPTSPLGVVDFPAFRLGCREMGKWGQRRFMDREGVSFGCT